MSTLTLALTALNTLIVSGLGLAAWKDGRWKGEIRTEVTQIRKEVDDHGSRIRRLELGATGEGAG